MISLNTIKNLTVELTSYCNLHCPQCPRFNDEGFLTKDLVLDHLDFDKFAKNFNLELFPNLEQVIFEGDYGDCTMHPEVDKFIKFFQSVPTLTLVTNGGVRSSQWWKNLAQQSNVKVIFSIDGLAETSKIYRINTDWKKVIENAQSFIKENGYAIWKYIVFKHNEHELEQARNLAKNIGFAEFLPVFTKQRWYSGSSWPVKVEGKYLYDIEPASSTTSLNQREKVAALTRYNNNFKFERSKCWLSRGAIYINYKGHVMPCCMTSGKSWQNGILDKLWRKLVGDMDSIDITKTTMDAIINGDFYQRKLEESWQSDRSIHPTCVAVCSN